MRDAEKRIEKMLADIQYHLSVNKDTGRIPAAALDAIERRVISLNKAVAKMMRRK